MQKHALFLIGSPKQSNSTSKSICDYLIRLSSKKGLKTQQLHILTALGSENGRKALLKSVEDSDIIIFSSPLYVDSIPYFVIETMELITNHRTQTPLLKKQKLIVISNCGFPESSQNEVALLIYRNFAREANFEWMGSLAFCMGILINGLPMSRVGIFYRNIRRAFEITANAMIEDKGIPDVAVELGARPFIPKWLYIWIGNHIFWRVLAIRNGAWHMRNAPYQGIRRPHD